MRTKNMELVHRIEEFIVAFQRSNGVSPTIAEIAEGTGTSHSNAGRYLEYMRDNGIIDYGRNKRRSIVSRETREMSRAIRVPVLGSVSCGIPKFAEENIEEYVQLPVSLFGSGDFYLLRADGVSMVNVGIEEGDLVLVRQQAHANPGQIVVALMEDEATLKRYCPEPEKHRIRLHPENDNLEDIYVDNCIIQGVAVKVLKDLR